MTTRSVAGDSEHRILIVDDEPFNRSLFSRLLKTSGYSTDQAENGSSALDLLQRETPDLILLDLEMPGMNGFELLEKLKADEKTRAIPVIIITGAADRESRLTALHHGAADLRFLRCPSQPTAVQESVHPRGNHSDNDGRGRPKSNSAISTGSQAEYSLKMTMAL